MTAWVVSPVIFLAIAGSPAVSCTWSLTQVESGAASG